MNEHTNQTLKLAMRNQQSFISIMAVTVIVLCLGLLSKAHGAVVLSPEWPPVLHNWTVTVPFLRMNFGVVEWVKDDSRVYLGVIDFHCSLGAPTIAAIFGGICFVAAMIVAWLLRKRRARV